MDTPAHIIIERFGGHQKVADILGLDVSRIYRWTYGADKGGTGGAIPGKHQISLLEEAKKRGVELSPADFFPVSSTEAA